MNAHYPLLFNIVLGGKSIAVKEENKWDQMEQEEDIIPLLPIIGTQIYVYSHGLVLSTLFSKLLISKSSS